MDSYGKPTESSEPSEGPEEARGPGVSKDLTT